MALEKLVSSDGKTITIKISGNFDFNLHREFREAYKETAFNGQAYIVDLNGTEYMDSSALGMLLLLREYGGGDNSNIKIVNSNSEIKKIFEISNFHRLFTIG